MLAEFRVIRSPRSSEPHCIDLSADTQLNVQGLWGKALIAPDRGACQSTLGQPETSSQGKRDWSGEHQHSVRDCVATPGTMSCPRRQAHIMWPERQDIQAYTYKQATQTHTAAHTCKFMPMALVPMASSHGLCGSLQGRVSWGSPMGSRSWQAIVIMKLGAVLTNPQPQVRPVPSQHGLKDP